MLRVGEPFRMSPLAVGCAASGVRMAGVIFLPIYRAAPKTLSCQSGSRTDICIAVHKQLFPARFESLAVQSSAHPYRLLRYVAGL